MPAPISHPHHQKDQRNGTFAGLTAADTVAQEEEKCGHLKQLHGALGGSQWLLSLGKRREGFLPACPGRVSKWKRCAACGQTLPIPTYFGDSDKELEETHTLPLGGQQSGDLLFQSLTGTLFPPSLFLWQPLVFLLLRYFALLQQKGQDGIGTGRDPSQERARQLSNFCFESAFWNSCEDASSSSYSACLGRL